MRKAKRIYKAETPLLLRLSSLEKLADVVEKLNRYQRAHHRQDFVLPPEFLEPPAHVIDAPDYEELAEMEIQREMKQKPKHQKRVKW